LRGVGHILNEACRGDDIACRYGGEEFVVLACNTTSQQASVLAERIRTRVERQVFMHHETPVQVTCSIGVADLRSSPPPGVVELADKALYRAKNDGRNRVVVANLPKGFEPPAVQRQVA
jgi:diguanylate cyclase (GGDEF)-like protein